MHLRRLRQQPDHHVPFSSVPVAAVIAGSEGYAQPKDFIISGFLNTTIVTVITFGLCWLVGPMVL